LDHSSLLVLRPLTLAKVPSKTDHLCHPLKATTKLVLWQDSRLLSSLPMDPVLGLLSKTRTRATRLPGPSLDMVVHLPCPATIRPFQQLQLPTATTTTPHPLKAHTASECLVSVPPSSLLVLSPPALWLVPRFFHRSTD
jgi:hypothetical protein